MILIALGSNLSGPWGAPADTLERAFAALNAWPLHLVARSPVLRTAPYGRKNQPDFCNAVALVETHLPPEALLRRLHMIERQAGRQRRLRWGPRTLDLDLLDYHGLVRPRRGLAIKPLALPHPEMLLRSFVMEPLAAIAPQWKHPVTHEAASVTICKARRLNAV
ncbi:MAG: 2-amino-4-hydroxy-6-hydroxymethyldihydropteridine diphosphokinase [Hyphomicrobiales bacterium]